MMKIFSGIQSSITEAVNRNRDFYVFLFLFLTAFTGIYLIFPTVARPLFIDESRGVNIAMLGFKGLIAEVAKDNHPPLYYIILSLWIRLFGISELAVRSLSLLCYGAGVFLTYRLSMACHKSTAGALFASALYASALITIAHSTNARMYSMLSVLLIVSFLLYAEYFAHKKTGNIRLAMLALANTAGVFTHYWFLFVVLSQAVFSAVMYRDKIKAALFSIFLPGLLLLLAWGGIFLDQATNKSMDFIKFHGGAIGETFNNFYYDRAWILYGVLLISAAAGMLKRIVEEKGTAGLARDLKIFFRDETNLFLAFSLAIILLAPYLVTRFLVPVYIPGRYTIVTFIPFVILLAGASYKFAEKRLLWFSFIIFFAVYILPWYSNYTPNYVFTDKWRADLVMQKGQDNDIIMYPGVGRVGVDYYLKRLNNSRHFAEFSFPADLDDKHPMWSNFEKMDAAALAELDKRITGVSAEMREKGMWLWVLWGYNKDVNEIIRGRLEKAFHERVMIKKGDGSFEVSVYEKKR